MWSKKQISMSSSSTNYGTSKMIIGTWHSPTNPAWNDKDNTFTVIFSPLRLMIRSLATIGRVRSKKGSKTRSSKAKSWTTLNSDEKVLLQSYLNLLCCVGRVSGVLCPKISDLSFSQSNTGSYAGNGDSPKCWKNMQNHYPPDIYWSKELKDSERMTYNMPNAHDRNCVRRLKF